MQKKPITEYDSTKTMLNTLRKLNESKQTGTLREQSQEQRISNDTSTFPKGEEQPSTQSMKNDLMVINDVEVKIMSGDNLDMKLMDDQKKSISGIIDNFKQQVSQIVDFEPGFTISPNQIRLDGTLTDDDVSFVFIAGEEGVRLNAYQNPGDVPTIGYGQTRINGRSVKLGDKMTKEEATVGLRSNIESHRAVAIKNIGQNSWNNIKDENAKAVLSSLAYNYGHVPPSVVVAAKTGDSKKIGDAVRELTNPRNTSYDSRLIGRSNREADFISTGVIQKADKDFLPGGKLSTPGVAPSTTAPTPAKPGVAPAGTPAATTQQIAQTVSQPAQQQQPQVTVAPMNMSTPQPQAPQSSGGGQPAQMSSGRQSPPMGASNDDNFFILYSKMVYSIVDG